MKQEFDAIVLGGGLAGLACADEILTNSKKKVLVLEKNTYLGGLAATLKKDGFCFDLAPHRWFTKNEELNSWLDKLMKKEMIWVEKYTPIYQFGKFFKYPIEIMDILKNINPLKTAVMMMTYLWARISKYFSSKPLVTMREAYISRFGLALYSWFNRDYNLKLWGKDFAEKMSADFVQQRMKDLSVLTILKQALGLEKKVISLTPRFRFPRKGIGRISDNLESRIKKNGGRIKKEVIIENITKKKGGYEVRTSQGAFHSEQIISSIPIDELVRLLSPSVPPKILRLIGRLNYIHQKIVVLLAKKPRLTRFTWVYIHPLKIRSFRFLETNNWSRAMSPKGKTSLVFEYPYQAGDEIEKMTDDQLVKITIHDLISYFSPAAKEADITKAFVFKIPKAYPKYDLDYQLPLSKVKKYLAKKYSGLQLIGRNGRFRYNNMDHSIYTGLLAARNVVAGREVYDLDKVNNKAEYIEEKKIK